MNPHYQTGAAAPAPTHAMDAPRLRRFWIAILGVILIPAALELWGCGGAGGSSPIAPSSSITVSDRLNLLPQLVEPEWRRQPHDLRRGIADVDASEREFDTHSSHSAGGVDVSNFRSTPAEKSATIRRWIVDFNAAQ